MRVGLWILELTLGVDGLEHRPIEVNLLAHINHCFRVDLLRSESDGQADHVHLEEHTASKERTISSSRSSSTPPHPPSTDRS